MNTTLAISHNLYLTREERYAWYAGDDLEVIGVSVPVWFHKGLTSEPAVEVFVKYKLLNRNENIFIKQVEDGYEIIIPPKAENDTSVPDAIWKDFTEQEREDWYRENEPLPSIQNVLDVKDGGSSYLAFRQLNKAERAPKKTITLVHFVEIKPIEDLLKTLT